MSDELLACETADDWHAWLAARNATTPDGVWLEFAKKGAPLTRVTYAQAVEVALCWGWIDGRSQGLDAHRWKQRFTPRRPRSLWSKVNREKAERLIAQGKMQPPGLVEVTRAKRDGRWDAAYDSPKQAQVPPVLAAALARRPKAKALFERLDATNRYAILHRLMVVKTAATRERNAERFAAALARGVVPYPDRLKQRVAKPPSKAGRRPASRRRAQGPSKKPS